METSEPGMMQDIPDMMTSPEDSKADTFALVTDMLERQGLGPEEAEVNILGNEVLVTLAQKTPYAEVMKIGRAVQDRMTEHDMPQMLVFEDHAMGESGARYLIPKEAPKTE